MHKRLENLRTIIAKFIKPTNNAMSLPSQFLKYGSKSMQSDWTDISMPEQDLYTGYGYGAIRNRANLVAKVALENVRTSSNTNDLIHPHLEIISRSKTFPDYKFWSDISTYLDLEGVFYLMAIRNFDGNRMGDIKEFKLLNSYNVRRVINLSDASEVTGYVETRRGLVREIPKEMIIEIRELNPFDEDTPFAMTDAAKESQFTLKQAGDYTRSSLRNNINAPGILSTDVILEEQELVRFTDRVKAHTKGEPIFSNGQGAITWENMQIDLSKAALRDINEMNRESLFAVSGVSKTIMGIEQSGVTRETSKVQRDIIIENHILPRIQLIIDSLNQDYENNYSVEFAKTKAMLVVDNPLGSDHDSELKDTEVKEKQLKLFSGLVDRGVKADVAAMYVRGEVTLEDLDLQISETSITEKDSKTDADNDVRINKNEMDKGMSGIVRQQEGALRNSIQNIEAEVVALMLSKLRNKARSINQVQDVELDEASDLITKTDKIKSVKDLAFVLGAFYGIIIMLRGGETMKGRSKEFSLPGNFKLTRKINEAIKELSTKVSEGHIKTIVADIHKTAHDAALAGKSLDQIEALIKQKYSEQISKARASTVARTETNRAFTMAQYEADKQFVEQNDLQGRVFKRWHTRSDNPCAFCRALEAEGEVPFSSNFRDLGDTVKVGDSVLDIGFSHLEAGNAHPNCACDYELIIRTDSKNSIDGKVKQPSTSDEAIETMQELVAKIDRKSRELHDKENELNKIADWLDNIV